MFKELFTESKGTISLPSIGKNLKIEEIQKEGTTSSSGRYPKKSSNLLVLSDKDNKYYFNNNAWWIIANGSRKQKDQAYNQLTQKERKSIWKLWGINLI